MVRVALGLAALLVPALAQAQPAPGPAPQDPTTGPPPPPPSGYPPPPPGYPPPSPYPQPAGYVAPSYAQPAVVDHRQGLTLEANVGFGLMWTTDDTGDASDSELSLGGLHLGIGAFLNPALAVSLRISGRTYSESSNGTSARVTSGFIGPTVQAWMGERAWIGGGLGIGVVAFSFSSGNLDGSDSETGLGVDLRAGYTVMQSGAHSVNISAELVPVFIDGGRLTTMSLLVGYQHL